MNKMLTCTDSQVLACSRLACGEYMRQTSTGYNTELPMWCSSYVVVVVWDYWLTDWYDRLCTTWGGWVLCSHSAIGRWLALRFCFDLRKVNAYWSSSQVLPNKASKPPGRVRPTDCGLLGSRSIIIVFLVVVNIQTKCHYTNIFLQHSR